MLILTSDHDFARLERKLDILIRLTRLSLNMETHEMALIDDLNAAEDAINDKLTAITNYQVATKAALDAKDAKLAELTTDLIAAQQAGAATPAALQAVIDKAHAILNVADNAATTEAVFAGTSAGPSGTPGDTLPPPADLPPVDVPPAPPVDVTPPVDTPPTA